MSDLGQTVYGDITVQCLHPAIAGAVHGVDFSEPLTAGTVTAIKQAWADHLVLVFPDQPISDEQHVAVTRYFGAPEVFHQNRIKSKTVPEIFRVANTDEEGNLVPPSDPVQQQLSSARKWHTDSSYREKPAIGSLLHGVEISRTGGVTCFTNMYAVYEALPGRLKVQVEGRKACHDFDMLSRLTGAPRATDAERAAMPPIWQPMVRRHPVTGRKSLYISPIYNDAIEGMADDAAVALIKELAEFAGQPQFVYEHRWSPDDIVMWDNRCTMHYVTPHDPSERRVMHRTTIAGEEAVEAA
ncbi:MAG: TauD/TfdA dioxygenase family protein [Hyphomicrobiaceae bacterium]